MSKSFSNILQSGGYILPAATTATLGGVKVDGTSITINGSGVISGSASYTLPTASASTLGGIKIGSGLSIDGSGVVTVTGFTSTLAVTSGGTGTTTSTGTGSVVLSNTPTLVTPVLGVATATSINKLTLTAPTTSAILTIADGKTLTANASITLAGTDNSTISVGGNVTFSGAFATTVAVTAATSVTLPISGTLISTTGAGVVSNTMLANSVISINGSNVSLGGSVTGLATTAGTLAQFAATTSSQLAGVISDETGSGALVFANTPTLVTPVLGVATATSINKVGFTAPATGSTLTIADGKTLTANSSITLAGTDSSIISVGGNVTFSGAFATTLNVTALTSVTLPTSGTLISTAPGTSGNVLTSNGSSWVSSAPTGAAATISISNQTANYTVVAGDLGKVINCTSGTFTVSLTAAATLGTGFHVTIWNSSTTATDAITIDPNLTETIDGIATIILRRGEGIQIICDGTNWQTGNQKELRGYAENVTNTLARTIASGDNSISIGATAQATAARSFSFGYGAVASFADAYAIGYSATASGDTSLAIGVSSTASGTVSLALGPNTTASATRSVAIGSNSSSQGSQAVTGAGAMALGGSYANGTDSLAAAIANNTNSYGALAANGVAIGYQTKASGGYSIAIGSSAVASGSSSVAIGPSANASLGNAVAIGYQANASGSGSTAIGSVTHLFGPSASALGTVAFGPGSSASIIGKYSYASGDYIATSTYSRGLQYGLLVLRGQSSSATPVILVSDPYLTAADGTNQIILPNDSTYSFTILVVARRTDVDGENAGWEFKGVVSRDTNAASTLLRGVSKTTLYKSQAAWDCTVTQDTTNGGIAVTVTGEAAKTIRWVATAQTSEVTG